MRKTLIVCAALALASCGRVAEGTKDALNKGGELAGSAATEVIEGVATGVENTWSIDVLLSEELEAKGVSLGKTQVESDSAGMDNRLIVYMIAEHGLNDTLQAIAVDEDGREMGRSTLITDLAPGAANHVTFKFQARTDLERKSRVEIR